MTNFFDLMQNIVNALNAVVRAQDRTVRIDKQNFTEEQKAMARTNIDAAGQVEVIEITEQVNNMKVDVDKIKETPVETTDDVEAGNTLPITSAGVYKTVGNIEALLKTI